MSDSHPPEPKNQTNAIKRSHNVRIGIDVGGTFTHAVALDADTLELLGKAKVSTTHRAKEGVAKGIVQSLFKLLDQCKIKAQQVTFIAHSTTQATNALLEGDVATVGILGMGAGANAWLAKLTTRLGPVEIAPGKFIATVHTFLDTTKPPDETVIRDALTSLTRKGAQVIAISESFSVDQPENETRALEIARSLGLLATSGSEVTQLYGLKVRTRTAVINASMLPKMIESANMTEQSVREAGINAPVMIMRSDGGVMDIEAMRKKPILTMLSGPAAGVAAATMFLHISDGIFLEVGGTSTDISAIANGRALVKSGEVGGNKVHMRTLDVRTVGIAGGSIPRLHGKRILDVGPRSAHIAGLGYVSFARDLGDINVQLIQPLPHDPPDYLAFARDKEKATLCVTPTCAANMLGLVPANDCAAGNMDAIGVAFKALGSKLAMTEKEAANELLRVAAHKCIPTIKAIFREYKLDPELVMLVGGGGGAASLVPYIAKELGMKHQLAEHADVISAIGVALALIRETIERQVVNPSKDEILRIRSEAAQAVQRMGADPKTVEIHLEIDNRANILRATAYGAAKIEAGVVDHKTELSEPEQIDLAAASMRVEKGDVTLAAQTSFFRVYTARRQQSRLFGLVRSRQTAYRVIEGSGIIRLQSQNGIVEEMQVKDADAAINSLIEMHAQWGDAGKVIPNVILLCGPKIVDLSGLMDTEKVLAVARTELENLPADDKVIVLAQMT